MLLLLMMSHVAGLFVLLGLLPWEIVRKLEALSTSSTDIQNLRLTSADEIGAMVRNQKYGGLLLRCAREFPLLQVTVRIMPLSRTVVRLAISLRADFEWNDRFHSSSVEPWWIWVEDGETDELYHSEHFLLHKRARYGLTRLTRLCPIHILSSDAHQLLKLLEIKPI